MFGAVGWVKTVDHRADVMKHIVIIGNGISGITAARHIRKRKDYKITVISSETDHFFSRTALMYVYMGHMTFQNIKPYEDRFWRKNKIDLLRDHVMKIHTETKSLACASGMTVYYDVLVIATGSTSNKFGWPGQDLKGVQCLYGYPDLQQMEKNTKGIKKAVIVGGGLIGIEMAEMLRSREIEVTILVREKEFWSNVLPLEEANMISRHLRAHQVDLRLETELKEIISGESERVRKVVTKDGGSITCDFVGLAVGVSPNISLMKGSGIEVSRGVLVNEYLETNIPDVYAIGDCVERTYDLPGRSAVEQVWYTGRMMGEVVAQTICDQKTKYEPGPWFNSAKFLDIEYQTYGSVGNVTRDDESEFYWEHEEGVKSMHLVWNKQSNEFRGINAFGIRLRHERFDRWLRDKRSIQFVMSHLDEANFDPEFFDRHEDEITSGLYEKYPTLKELISA
jgi:NADH oxidase (H2O2-forming)